LASSLPSLDQVLKQGSDDEWRESARRVLVEGRPASGTQTARQCAWRQWQLFAHGSGKEERLCSGSTQEEDLVLDWISHMAFVRRLKWSTIKGKIGHLNATHAQRGWGAPLDNFKRVSMAITTLRKAGGGTKRKHPAGPPILRRCLKLAEQWSPRNRMILRAALAGGFHFMWRCSEYLSRGGAGWDATKVLLGRDLSFKADGMKLEPEDVARATEVTAFVKGSKTDQFNEGCLLTHHIAGSDVMDLCVVRALRDVAMLFPERLTTEAHLPFFRWEDGSPITRTEVKGLLSTAALQEGMPAETLNLHSLRVGGASALYHATGGNVEVVKRLGRWSSTAFEGYLWEDRSLTKGLAGAMLRAPWHVHTGAL
jgi:hypothetical protein